MLVGQWIRLTASPGTYSRTPAACGVMSSDLRRMTLPPGSKPGGEGNSVTLTSIGITIKGEVAGNCFETRNKPNGSPDDRVVGPSANPPRLVSQVRAVYERFCPPRKKVMTRDPVASGTLLSFNTSSHNFGIRLVLVIS